SAGLLRPYEPEGAPGLAGLYRAGSGRRMDAAPAARTPGSALQPLGRAACLENQPEIRPHGVGGEVAPNEAARPGRGMVVRTPRRSLPLAAVPIPLLNCPKSPPAGLLPDRVDCLLSTAR